MAYHDVVVSDLRHRLSAVHGDREQGVFQKQVIGKRNLETDLGGRAMERFEMLVRKAALFDLVSKLCEDEGKKYIVFDVLAAAKECTDERPSDHMES